MVEPVTIHVPNDESAGVWLYSNGRAFRADRLDKQFDYATERDLVVLLALTEYVIAGLTHEIARLRQPPRMELG